jgi:hypothetical protein
MGTRVYWTPVDINKNNVGPEIINPYKINQLYLERVTLASRNMY